MRFDRQIPPLNTCFNKSELIDFSLLTTSFVSKNQEKTKKHIFWILLTLFENFALVNRSSKMIFCDFPNFKVSKVVVSKQLSWNSIVSNPTKCQFLGGKTSTSHLKSWDPIWVRFHFLMVDDLGGSLLFCHVNSFAFCTGIS